LNILTGEIEAALLPDSQSA